MSQKWLLGCLTAGAPGPYSPVEFSAIDEFLEQVTRTSVMRHLVHLFFDWGEGVCTDLRGSRSLERGDGRWKMGWLPRFQTPNLISLHGSSWQWLKIMVLEGMQNRWYLPSLKLRQELKMDGWTTSFLLGWAIFRCYVSFREGRYCSFINVGLSEVVHFATSPRRCRLSWPDNGRTRTGYKSRCRVLWWRVGIFNLVVFHRFLQPLLW